MVQLDVSYRQWMQDTGLGRFHQRGRLLKRLDDAIEQHAKSPSSENAFGVRQAFDDWKTSKLRQGRGHWPSDRDRLGAVTALETQLATGGVEGDAYRQTLYDDPVHGQALRQADEVFVAENRGRLQTIFEGAQVVFHAEGTTGSSHTSRMDYVLHPVKQAQSAVTGAITSLSKDKVDEIKKKFGISDDTMSKAGDAVEWATAFYTLANAAFGTVLWNKVESTPLGQHVKDIIKEATAFIPPWVGVVWSAHSVGQEWASVAVSFYKSYDIGHRDYAMADGSPLAAFNAVRSALKTELAIDVSAAAISTGAFVGKTLSSHLDAGAFVSPLIGLGEAIASAAQKITIIAFQYRAAQAMMAKLKNPSGLDITVFKTFPLLGAYYIHCAELSALIPLANRFSPGWMGRTEALKRESRYVFEAAQQLIDKCPFKIVNIQKIKADVKVDRHGVAKHIYGDLEGVITSVEGLIMQAAGVTS